MSEPQTSRDDGRDAVLEALEEVMPRDVAERALARALACEHMSAVPESGAALRFFVTGALRRVLVEEMGLVHFDVVVNALGRRMTSVRPRPGSGSRHRRVDDTPCLEPERRILVLSVDAHGVEALAQRLGPSTSVTRIETLFDLAPLLEIGPEQSVALVLDVPLAPVPLTTLARMAHLIPPMCPVLVVGLDVEAWARARALLPITAEWQRVARLEDARLADLA